MEVMNLAFSMVDNPIEVSSPQPLGSLNSGRAILSSGSPDSQRWKGDSPLRNKEIKKFPVDKRQNGNPQVAYNISYDFFFGKAFRRFISDSLCSSDLRHNSLSVCKSTASQILNALGLAQSAPYLLTRRHIINQPQ